MSVGCSFAAFVERRLLAQRRRVDQPECGGSGDLVVDGVSGVFRPEELLRAETLAYVLDPNRIFLRCEICSGCGSINGVRF
jgi:hypothetical protein